MSAPRTECEPRRGSPRGFERRAAATAARLLERRWADRIGRRQSRPARWRRAAEHAPRADSAHGRAYASGPRAVRRPPKPPSVRRRRAGRPGRPEGSTPRHGMMAARLGACWEARGTRGTGGQERASEEPTRSSRRGFAPGVSASRRSAEAVDARVRMTRNRCVSVGRHARDRPRRVRVSRATATRLAILDPDGRGFERAVAARDAPARPAAAAVRRLSRRLKRRRRHLKRRSEAPPDRGAGPPRRPLPNSLDRVPTEAVAFEHALRRSSAVRTPAAIARRLRRQISIRPTPCRWA